jgi:hypothetical protein
MTRNAAGAAIFGFILMLGFAARAEDALTPGDFQWLKAQMNVAPGNSIVQVLTPAQKTSLHALIADRKPNADAKRQAVAQFLQAIVAGNFERTLKQSEE